MVGMFCSCLIKILKGSPKGDTCFLLLSGTARPFNMPAWHFELWTSLSTKTQMGLSESIGENPFYSLVNHHPPDIPPRNLAKQIHKMRVHPLYPIISHTLTRPNRFWMQAWSPMEISWRLSCLHVFVCPRDTPWCCTSTEAGHKTFDVVGDKTKQRCASLLPRRHATRLPRKWPKECRTPTGYPLWLDTFWFLYFSPRLLIHVERIAASIFFINCEISDEFFITISKFGKTHHL